MRTLYVLLLLLLVSPLLAEPVQKKVKVGLVPVSVRGDYRPLNAEQTTNLLLERLQATATKSDIVLLENAGEIIIPNQASAAAKKAGVDVILWGDVLYKKAESSSRQPYYRGRVKVYVTAEVAIQVYWVPGEKLILSQPTWVNSNEQTDSWIMGGDSHLSAEQKLARTCIGQAAESLVHVVRKREQAGWFRTAE